MATTEYNDLERQIIETAQQLFIEKGFAGTSMSDIAATVGINRPTLHYYFRTKDKMFKAVFGSIVISLMPKIHDIIKLDIPFVDRMGMVLNEYIELFTKEPYLPKFICGEIQRDVNHLLEVAKELQFEAALSLVKDTLLAEMEAGKIKKVPLPMVFLTFYSLLTYPFLVRNLITTLFLDNEEDFTSFLQEWKQHIITELTNLLSNDK
ncbi:TetR/AcrR family transcriptional regulator [Bacteroides congonensis]|uniref:TetR/AcrR family transcriptional regulator n=1 Tax=Bacteroides congonensis TaxID=1871006 RepID=UPI0026746EF8|nr:TetR/AcrR family transcriptional regulator [Bacteroides congonensis]